MDISSCLRSPHGNGWIRQPRNVWEFIMFLSKLLRLKSVFVFKSTKCFSMSLNYIYGEIYSIGDLVASNEINCSGTGVENQF